MTSNVVLAEVRQAKEQGHSDNPILPGGNAFTEQLVSRRAEVGGAGTTCGWQVNATSEVNTLIGFGAEDFGFLYDDEQRDDDDQTLAGVPAPSQIGDRGPLRGLDQAAEIA